MRNPNIQLVAVVLGLIVVGAAIGALADIDHHYRREARRRNVERLIGRDGRLI